MSYYTGLEVQHFENAPVSIQSLLPRIASQLDDDGISRDVLKDLEEAFTTGKATLKVHSGYVAILIDLVHQLAPEAEFGVRASGEELRDVWIKEFRQDQKFQVGPFDEGTPPPIEGQWFTRTGATGWRGLLRPAYLKTLLVLFLAAVILITFRTLGGSSS